MKVKEVRIVRQEWFETEATKTGWDSFGWVFDDGSSAEYWEDFEVLKTDKFGNSIVGIATREITLFL